MKLGSFCKTTQGGANNEKQKLTTNKVAGASSPPSHTAHPGEGWKEYAGTGASEQARWLLPLPLAADWLRALPVR